MLKASNKKIAALAVLMALTACGGGGGSNTPASDPSAATGSSGNAPSPAPSPSPSPSPAPGPAPVPAPVPAPAPTTASAPARAPVQVTSASAASGIHVAQFPNGGHVVIWDLGGQTDDPNNPGSVYAQVFDANEQKVGSPITVFSGGRGFASGGVAALPDGSFAVSGETTKVDTATNHLLDRLFVQKVGTSGRLLPGGGIPDADVNSGLADLVHSEDNGQLVSVSGGPFFVNGDGSYALALTRNEFQQQPAQETSTDWLLNVDAAGIAEGQPVEIGTQSTQSGGPPVIARLTGGNFLFASTPMVTDGRGGFVFGPVTWKVVTGTGQVVAQQALEAGAQNPEVAALADGTGLLAWTRNNAMLAERIDGNGNVVATASTPNTPATVTGLAGGGYVSTWVSGTQILAQYFTSSGAAAADPFVVADNVAFFYTVARTSDGFIVVYSATDKQVYEVQVKAPQFG